MSDLVMVSEAVMSLLMGTVGLKVEKVFSPSMPVGSGALWLSPSSLLSVKRARKKVSVQFFTIGKISKIL